MRLTTLAAVVAMAASVATPVLADCYDLVGCTDRNDFNRHYGYLVARDGPNCDFLYQMRNRIYAEHGYCFVTPRAIEEIGNDGCYIHDQSRVPLSRIERNNVAVIHRAEVAKGCTP